MNARSLEDGGGREVCGDAVALEVGDEIGHVEGRYRINAASSTAFMPLPQCGDSAHQCGRMEAAEKIRQWLIATAEEHGLTYAAWAKLAQVAPSTIQRAVKPNYAFITSSRTIAKLAQAIGVAPPTIESSTTSEGTLHAPTFLPIRYEVGAGIWRAVEDVQEFYGSGPVLADPAYAGFAQWLERVTGDSMDREYPANALLHVVDAIAIGYAPRAGDHVIIERRRAAGGVVERTVKEVAMTPDGPEFWPRSNNPRWSAPITLHDGHDQEDCEVEIVGLVLGSYRSRRA